MKKSILYFSIISLLIFACKEKEDPVIPNEEELITTVEFTLTDSISNEKKVFTFRDLDGDGGNDPVVTIDTLEPNKTYLGSLRFLQETGTDTINITEEVAEEDTEHQVFYDATPDNLLTITYEDQDSNGNPLGLATKIKTSTSASGNLIVILRHEPQKGPNTSSPEDFQDAGGETDIQVSFDIFIQ